MDTTAILFQQTRAILNNGPVSHDVKLDTNREAEEGTSALPRPDPMWSYVDQAGHWHGYGTDGTLPTLIAHPKHKDCDRDGATMHHGPGHCEGYTVVKYRCAICDAKVKPGRLTGAYSFTILGPETWTATVRLRNPRVGALVLHDVGASVTAWFLTSQSTARNTLQNRSSREELVFGLGHITGREISSGGSNDRGGVVYQISAGGPLSRRAEVTAADRAMFDSEPGRSARRQQLDAGGAAGV